MIPIVNRSGLPEPKPTTVMDALIRYFLSSSSALSTSLSYTTIAQKIKHLTIGAKTRRARKKVASGLPTFGKIRSSSVRSFVSAAPIRKAPHPAATPLRLAAVGEAAWGEAGRRQDAAGRLTCAPGGQRHRGEDRRCPREHAAGVKAGAGASRERREVQRGAVKCAATPAMVAPVMPNCGTSKRLSAA